MSEEAKDALVILLGIALGVLLGYGIHKAIHTIADAAARLYQ